MATPEKYSHIKFTPPAGAKSEAKKGLAWRREHGRGGTAVGIARARDLSNGTEVSPSTVRRMKAFFDRHEGDKKGDGWSPGEDSFPSNGRIAWALWGSDEGWAWARKVVEQMNAADEKDSRSLRPFGSTQGIKPKVVVVHGPPASGKTSYVMEHKGDNDVLFDFDSVMSALSGLPPHQKNQHLISYCTDIRTLIIERALRAPPVDRTWIITTSVRDDMKSQLSDIPVEYIHIDTPKEECLKRIEDDPERKPVAEELRQAVERYFSQTDEQRSAQVLPNVETRFLGNFNSSDASDPELLKVERRADPSTGKPQTYVVGYAARFGKDSLLLGDFVERIDPAAFDIVEKRADSEGKPLETRCLFNHDPNHLLGRFPTTMKMFVDDKGLRYECILPESRQDIAESISRGDLRGSSFSFVVADGGEKWTYEQGRSTRLVTKIKSLLDCGPVTYPAYSDATVQVAKRSYEEFTASKTSTVESRNAVKAKAAEEFAKTREFLEARAFCKTGSKPPVFGVKGKSNLHFNPNGGSKNVAKDAELAAKSSGVKTVSVQSWSKDHDSGLKAAGFKKTGGYATKSEDHDIWIKDLSKKSSKRSRQEIEGFLAERRAFCPKGEGEGIDNSCSSTGGDKAAASGKEKSPGKKTGEETSGASAGPKDSKYMEWDKTKDHKSPAKTKEAQDFLDKAREEQMSKGGKDQGQSDEGGGVQTWSKGDHFPWTPKQVGTDEGYVQGLHPDGSKTEKYPFSGGKSEEAYKKLGDEIKKKGKRSSQVISETMAFLMARAR